jgi:hypothetical protein
MESTTINKYRLLLTKFLITGRVKKIPLIKKPSDNVSCVPHKKGS